MQVLEVLCVAKRLCVVLCVAKHKMSKLAQQKQVISTGRPAGNTHMNHKDQRTCHLANKTGKTGERGKDGGCLNFELKSVAVDTCLGHATIGTKPLFWQIWADAHHNSIQYFYRVTRKNWGRELEFSAYLYRKVNLFLQENHFKIISPPSTIC